MDRTKGLDLILHTPGGSIASTQSIVYYVQQMFDRNIRAIVPQIAMSAGTMIACSCREIWLAKHSNLGPIDPHLNAIPAYGVIREFRRACREIKKDPAKIPIWQQIIGQYRPTFLGRCENAIKWSNQFVEDQLATVMFLGTGHERSRDVQPLCGMALLYVGTLTGVPALKTRKGRAYTRPFSGTLESPTRALSTRPQSGACVERRLVRSEISKVSRRTAAEATRN